MQTAFARFYTAVRNLVDRAHATKEHPDDDSFSRLAIDLFNTQNEHVPILRSLCRALAIAPGTITHWSGIPPLTTEAFKEFEVTSIPPERRRAIFLSSGTSASPRSRHIHDHESLALYQHASTRWFQHHLIPENRPLRILSLVPPFPQVPHSSLACMCDSVIARYGTPDSASFGRVTLQGDWEIELPSFTAELSRIAIETTPCLLIGTAFAWVQLIDQLESQRRTFVLPAGSRLMETGGYKGRSREMTKAQLHFRLQRQLGLPENAVVSEYGMSELGSQAYDRVFGSPSRGLQFPPWARVQLVSPENGKPSTPGETGIVTVYDLVNIRSVLAIQTGDLARFDATGLQLLGRASSSPPRGCSLMQT
jgi:acyl-CoA synthetase (AMP-forming)/AMP-acid ligase II